MNLNRLFTHRIVLEASKYLCRDISKTKLCSKLILIRAFSTSETAMAQRSITSFFKITPSKSTAPKKEQVTIKEENNDKSPIVIAKEMVSMNKSKSFYCPFC